MIQFVHTCKSFFYSASLFFLCNSCGNNTVEPTDSIDKGKIYISVDESFKPVIDSQIRVFEARNPEAKIVPLYKSEAECIRDFAVDSIRLVIITRRFSPGEENYMVDSLKVGPKSLVIAEDAVSVIVNPAAPDSLFTMNEIRQILTGKFKKNLIPIFDGTHATSTVRFIIDSVLHGDSLTSKTMAAKSSEGVIDYVSKTPDAVGFIGVSWIGNHEDTSQMSFLKKVKMAQLESTNIPGAYILPVQANIYTGRYPMIRDLVYVLKERHIGLGRGFANFLSGEIGQKIFWRSYLVPAQLDLTVRPTILNE